MSASCAVAACDREPKGRGFCGAHLERLRNGRPLDAPIRPRGIDFELLVDKSADCWEWTGSANSEGYGRFGKKYVHRLMHERYAGPIPRGFQVDHLCRNRLCCNPDHLEAVTPRENTLRSDCPGALAIRTNRCKRGHAYTAENTSVSTLGHRSCRTCARELLRKPCPICGEVRSSLPRHLRLVHGAAS